MKSKSRFTRGSGCYTCRTCKKLTRSTGRGDNENCQLCADCFDLAGIDNHLSDNGEINDYKHEVNDIFARRPELVALFLDLANETCKK